MDIIIKIKPRGIIAQNTKAKYFINESLYFIETPKVLKTEINPCFKCAEISKIATI